MAHERILIVEDDPAMLRGLRDNFDYEGYEVQTASDGEAGLNAALDGEPDLIVLDIMLPKINGYEVCRLLREEGIETPIIMLTAKGQESDVVLGLDVGADDYVTKPFSIKELLARVNAFLRRRRQERSKVVQFGPYELDKEARMLHRNGAVVPLTPKEYEVLGVLLRRPGRVVSREALLKSAWGYSVFVSARSVDRCITTLRKKIEADPHHPAFIKTVREAGYRFEVPAE